MRILYPTPKLQDYMMRTPLTIEFHNILSSLAPHTLTTRWTQNVPSNKYWVIESMMVSVRRATAAAPVGLVTARVRLSDNGKTTWLINYQFSDNTVDFTHQVIMSGPIYIVPLTTVVFETQDASTGGSVSYTVSGHLFEYEA